MQLLIERDGSVRCLYDETLNLGVLGQLAISRGSHVEPDEQGRWTADLSPVDGPQLGPFQRRSEALAAERAWLEEHWLSAPHLAQFKSCDHDVHRSRRSVSGQPTT